MNLCIAQLNYKIADFEGNLAKMSLAVKQAAAHGVDLIIFSELSICGYPPLDMLEQQSFIAECQDAVQRLAKKTSEVGVIVGAPAYNPNDKGKRLYNAAYLLYAGKIQEIRYKTLLPTYDVFDEYRYFEPNSEFEPVEFKGVRIALTICEDIWDDQPVENTFDRPQLYPLSPMDQLVKKNPDIMINISASPFAANRLMIREQVLRKNVLKYGIPILYSNQVGAHTELIFDGSSMALDSYGQVVGHLSSFAEDSMTFLLEDLLHPKSGRVQVGQQILSDEYRMEMIYKALIFGIKDYFRKMGFQRAVLGLSGGMDSALTLVLAVKALGAENVLPVLMPSHYSSDHSVTDSIQLCKTLNISWETIPIDPVITAFSKQLAPLFQGLAEDVTEENIQARTRGVLLMALANKQNRILLNTSNKSEMAVGYSTLYGDLNGGLAVLGDVYKTDIYRLAAFINKNQEIIPLHIIQKPPSAELRRGQLDSDSLPDYPLLDAILYRLIEMKMSVNEIVMDGYEETQVKKAASLLNKSEYKRFQAPPILRVSSKAFGTGRRMPLVAKF